MNEKKIANHYGITPYTPCIDLFIVLEKKTVRSDEKLKFVY